MTSRRTVAIGIFFLVLIAGGIVGARVIGIKGDAQRYNELFKFYLTLIQVGGIGGIATLLLEWYKQSVAEERIRADKEEARRKRIDEQSRQVFLEARKAYDTLKRTRRLLQDELKAEHPSIQTLAVSLQTADTAASLVAHGRVLFDPQLSLESLDEQAEYSKDLPEAATLAHYFQGMEKQANIVSDALRAAPTLDQHSLQAVCDFLDTGKFREHFTEPYNKAVQILLGSHIMEANLVKFVEFLQRNKIRATYGAIADAADVSQRSVGQLLGIRCPLASWVVNAKTGEPTGYSENEKHPDLRLNEEIITSGDDLIRRMKRERR